MSEVDTSAEAVERLAAACDKGATELDEACALTGVGVRGVFWHDWQKRAAEQRERAATLRALLAERDSYKTAVENAVAAIQHNHDEWLKMQAERDAARAEAARLREAERNNWHRMCDLVALMTEGTPPGGSMMLIPEAAARRYGRASDLAHKIVAAHKRAALAAKEPGHE